MMAYFDEQYNPITIAHPQNPNIHVDAALENVFEFLNLFRPQGRMKRVAD